MNIEPRRTVDHTRVFNDKGRENEHRDQGGRGRRYLGQLSLCSGETVDGGWSDGGCFWFEEGKISATKVVEEPVNEVEHQRKITGQMPPPPPPADVPIIIAVVAPAPVPAPEARAELPKTGSLIPLAGSFGCVSLLSSFGLSVIRRTF